MERRTEKKCPTPVKSPLKTQNIATPVPSSRSWARPRIGLSKTLSRQKSECFSSGKRTRSEQENEDSGLGFDSDGSGKRPASANPFMRSHSMQQFSTTSEVTLEPYDLRNALNVGVFGASALVDGLRSLTENQQEKESVIGSQVTLDEKPQEEAKRMPYKDYFDWSLKTKLSLTSQEAPNFVTTITPQDSIRASRSMKAKNAPAAVRFLQSLRYWIYPVLGGISTFPRCVENPADQTVTDWNKVMPSLYADWKSSLGELAEAVQIGECPFFYVNTDQWTALVVSKDLVESTEDYCYITPTTIGLRNMLRRLEIGLETPLGKSATDQPTDDLDTSSGSEGSFTASGWIMEQCKRVGKVVKPADAEKQEQIVDGRPESLIKLRGSDVAKFIEALIADRSLHPNGGRLTNVPPTLIAPVYFGNASGKKLEYRHAKSAGLHVLEIFGGPVMPHVIPVIAQLMKETQQKAEPIDDKIAFDSLESNEGLVRVNPARGNNISEAAKWTSSESPVVEVRTASSLEDFSSQLKEILSQFKFL